MNSWPSVLPTEPDLTWYLSDMCNYYYELSVLGLFGVSAGVLRAPCKGSRNYYTCANL